MFSPEQLDTILKNNGLTAAAGDEQIRSALLAARYSHDEADTALSYLREQRFDRQTKTDGIHKIFRTDETLDPREISNLLGIEVDASQFSSPIQESYRNYADMQYIMVWCCSVVIAITGIMLYMYFNDVGIFHPSQTGGGVVTASEGL